MKISTAHFVLMFSAMAVASNLWAQPVQLVSGFDDICALKDQKVTCYNTYGAVDRAPVAPKDLKNPSSLFAGGWAFFAVTDEGLRGWGDNGSGQLDIPKEVRFANSVAMGNSHVCAINSSQKVSCWGRNQNGELEVPKNLSNVKLLAAGLYHTCALADQGVQCWGGNWEGQTDVPSDLKGVQKLFLGRAYSCAVTDEGIKCWGEFLYLNQPPLSNPDVFASGYFHVCVRDLGQVTCWGNDRGYARNVPKSLTSPDALSAGFAHTCAAIKDRIQCWGNFRQGHSWHFRLK